METELNQAISMRENGHVKESNQLLLTMVQEYPNHARVHFHCAWSFDLLGKESQAVTYYERAINLGLSGNELSSAFLGLGSTYRSLGEYEKSKETFLKGMELFPENRAMQVFYSMTLYNLRAHSEAMEILLRCLVETSSDDELLKYKKAIDFYANKLDTVWTDSK